MFMLRNSGSPKLNEITGISLGLMPVARKARKNAMLLSPLIECENHVGLRFANLADDSRHVGIPHRQVGLADNGPADALDLVLDNLVGRVRKHIVGANPEKIAGGSRRQSTTSPPV